MVRVALTILTVALLGGDALAASSSPWVIGPAEARRALARGALLLDVRGAAAFRRGHVPGSQRVSWRQLSRRGHLASKAALKRALSALGVRRNQAVLVAGDPAKGWGDDGRVVWTLRSVGHDKAALVDGGVPALRGTGVRLTTGAPGRATATRFTVRLRRRWSISVGEVKKRLGDKTTAFIDAREHREFRGATPYGERRGGHLLGALHLHYRSLLDKRGRLLPTATLRRRLRALGLKKTTPVVAYCTGGVRSAWLVVVLRHLGYTRVRNYAGSMWEWAALPAATHPLVR